MDLSIFQPGTFFRLQVPSPLPSWIVGIWGFEIQRYDKGIFEIVALPETGILRGPSNLANSQWDPITKSVYFVWIKSGSYSTCAPVDWLNRESGATR